MADQDDDVFEDTSKAEVSLDTDRTANGSIARQDTIDEGSNGLEKDEKQPIRKFSTAARVVVTGPRMRKTTDNHGGVNGVPDGEYVESPSLSRRGSILSSISSVHKSSSSGDGGYAAYGQAPPIIQGNLQIINSMDCGEKVASVIYTDDGLYIAGGLMNGQIRLFNAANGNHITFLQTPEIEQDRMPVSRIRCKPGPDGTGSHSSNHLIAATYVSGYLRIWNYDNGLCVGQVRDENKDAEYLCLSHNPFADFIAIGTDNGTIKVYDEKTLQVVSLLKKSLSTSKVDGHTDRVFAIANHPSNAHEFVSSGWDNTLQFWDVRCPNSIRSIYGVFVCGEGLSFDRRGKELMVASWRPWRNLQFLDYSSGGILAEAEPDLQPHYLTSSQYCTSKDYVIATATDKGIVKVVDRAKLATVASYKESNSSSSGGGGIYSVAMSASSGGIQQTTMGVGAGIGGAGQTGGAGQPGTGTQNQTFAITCRNSIVILNFVK